jgi:spore maturation protein CgeB
LRTQPPYRGVFAKLSRGKIPQDEVPVLYSSARININCTLQDCIDWDVITLRTFEVLACGGFLITDEVPSLKQVCGDAAVITTGGTDLESKIEHYLSHEKERKEVAATGPEVARRFSIDAMAHRFIDYLEEVVQ